MPYRYNYENDFECLNRVLLADMKDTTIVTHRHDRFTVLPKAVTEGGTGMSLKALGLLTYLLGKPDGWKTWVGDIAKRFLDKQRSIRSGLRELRLLGYADLEPIRGDHGGVNGTFWKVSDEPIFLELNRTQKFLRKHGVPLRTEIAVSSNSRNVKLTKRESDETATIVNTHCTAKTQGKEKPINNTEPAVAGAGGNGSSPKPELAVSLEAKANAQWFLNSYRVLVKRHRGFVLRITPALTGTVELWFQEHKAWQGPDVLYVAHLAMQAAYATSRPREGFDKYLYSRFADRITWFSPDRKTGQDKVEAASREVDYGPGDLDAEEIMARIEVSFKSNDEVEAQAQEPAGS